jgi:hypothetical protein
LSFSKALAEAEFKTLLLKLLTEAGQDSPSSLLVSKLSVNHDIASTYFFHGPDGPHLVKLCAESLDLDANVGTLLDDLVTVVSPLRRRRVRVEFDVGGDHLRQSVPEQLQEMNYDLQHARQRLLESHIARRSLRE